MKKIVILTDPSRKNDKLIHTLRTLFPECDIQIHLKQTESSGNVSQIKAVAATYKAGEKDAKAGYARNPKHYWPDDPIHAQATARVRPKR